jgi:hypothetical protein
LKVRVKLCDVIEAISWFCLGFATCGLICIYIFLGMMEKTLKRLVRGEGYASGTAKALEIKKEEAKHEV